MHGNSPTIGTDPNLSTEPTELRHPNDSTSVKDGDEELARNSLAATIGTAASRISGLARVVVIAAVFGPTFLGNLFQTLNLVPNLIFELVVGQLVASLLVPPLIAHLDRGDLGATQRLARGFLGLSLALFAGVGVAVGIGGPIVLRLLSVGIDDPAMQDAYRSVGLPLLVLLIPQVLAYAIAATGNAVLQARGKFALTSAAPVFENVGVILTVIGFGVIWGAGEELTTVSTSALLFLGIGTTLSTTLHAGVQWWGAAREGISLRPTWGWNDPEVRSIARLARSSAGWAFLNAGRIFATLVVAGSVAGGVVAFQLAFNAVQAVVALGARPTAMALLGPLARSFHAGDGTRFRRDYDRGLTNVLFMTIPAAVMLLVLSGPIGAAVAVGEMASPNGVRLLTAVFAGIALSAVGDGTFLVATNALYAKRDSASPLRAMVLRAALLAIGLAVTTRVDDPALMLLGIGASFAISDAITGLMLDRRVRRTPGGDRLSARQLEFRVGSAFAALASAVTALVILVAAGSSSRLVVVLAGGAAVAVYVGLKDQLGSDELDDLVGAAKR